jgi:uncharacterized membrane protein YbhN (UPF0104 family)
MWRWTVRRHDVDILSLVFGLFFLGAAAIWGLSHDAIRAAGGWPLPTLLITVGVVGLMTALVGRGPRAARPAPDESEPPP